MDDYREHKKIKGTKKCEIKRRLMFKNYKYCLFNDKTMLKSQQRFKSDCHNIYTEEINKLALSKNDDKRLQTFEKLQRIHTEQAHSKYPKVSFEETVLKKDFDAK